MNSVNSGYFIKTGVVLECIMASFWSYNYGYGHCMHGIGFMTRHHLIIPNFDWPYYASRQNSGGLALRTMWARKID